MGIQNKMKGGGGFKNMCVGVIKFGLKKEEIAMATWSLKKILVGIVCVLALPLAMSGVGTAEPVKFNAVTMLPKGNPIMKSFEIFADAFNKKYKGEAFINWRGGPEIISPFQQHAAVRSGAIDMAATSGGYYTSLLPVSHSLMYSNKTHEEMRRAGFFEVFEKAHRDVGLVYLCEISFGRKFYLYVNDRIKTPKDLAGKKIRVFPTVAPIVKALGAAPVNMAITEIYTAMERGVVDGFVMTVMGFVKAWSWHEVTKYMIEPGFYRGTVAVLINPKKWGELSPDLQKRIRDWKYNVFDPDAAKFYMHQAKTQKQLILDSKVQVIEFSPADAKAFLKIGYDSAWEGINKQAPELGPKLQRMLIK
jgi:TRAP-type C4-dicarboxylate transport system substrate-binding protein